MAASWLNPEWRPIPKTTIVFVHGAIVNGWEMTLLRHRLRQLGYNVRQFHYHSILHGLETNVVRLRKFLDGTEGDVVHVVAHSMGGVLTRHVFEQMPDPRPGRLIAIGSPFLDCWIGHRIARTFRPLGRYWIGRTVYDHNRGKRDATWRGSRELGVIAGTYPFGIGAVFRDLPRPSDGVVLWDETRLQGVRDHVTYRLNHFGMLLSKRCAMQVARFLATGAFAPVVQTSPLEQEDWPVKAIS